MDYCDNCLEETGAPDWKARCHILWANKHGRAHRIFCDTCGQWTDKTYDAQGNVKSSLIVKEPHTTIDIE